MHENGKWRSMEGIRRKGKRNESKGKEEDKTMENG